MREPLSDFFTELVGSSRPRRYEHSLRVSSFPLCSRELVLSRFITSPLYTSETYMMDHYAEMGTIQHAAAQKWLTPVLFGNWRCYCGAIISNQLGPQQCPENHKHGEMEYEEYTLTYGKMTGHCDGVLRATGDSSHPLVRKLRILYDSLSLPYTAPIMLEVKTKSSGDIEARKSPDWFHYLQANTYACLLSHNIEAFREEQCQYVVIFYVSRANHRVHKAFLRKVNQDAFNSLCTEMFRALNLVNEKVLPMGICASSTDENGEDCVFKNVCFSPSIASELGLKEE